MKLTKAQQWLVDQIGDGELRVIFMDYGHGDAYRVNGRGIARRGLTQTFEALRRNGVLEPASSERRGVYRVIRKGIEEK
jgi:hypothetical protein